MFLAIALSLVAAPKPVSFRAEVAPILVAKCLGCHNDRKASGGLNLKTFALLKKGGKAGGAETILPGKPDESHLVEVLRPGAEPRMPLKLSPLSQAQIATVERWIKEGAAFDGGPESTPLASIVDPLRDLPRIAVKGPVSDPVTALAYARDGATLAAGIGKSVSLYDRKSGRVVASFEDHPGPVSALAFTPDGKSLVVAGGRAGQFGFVDVWDLATRTRRLDLRGHADAILAGSLSPDGRTFATASFDRTVKLWDLVAGREARTLNEHTDAVHAVGFSPDGARLASGGADRTVKVWDVATGKRLVSFSDSTGEVYALAFSKAGSTLFAGGVDRSIRAWTLTGQGGHPLKSIFAHEAPLIRLAPSPDGKRLISTGEDRRVEVWNVDGLKPIASLGPQPDWPQALAISPDSTTVAIGRHDGSIATYALADGKPALALRDAPTVPKPAPKPKPTLLRAATLAPPSPRGAERGKTVRVVLNGSGLGEANAVYFDDPGFAVKAVRPDKPDLNRYEFDLTIPATVGTGVHSLRVQTPLGIPAPALFVVDAYPARAEVEPNDDPKTGKPTPAPATLLGTIDRPGDVDAWRFEAKAGQDLVFEAIAKRMGSTLDAVLTLLDDVGRPLGRATAGPGEPDPVLSVHVPRDGVVTLLVSDAQYGGDGNHVYRIAAGRLPRVTSVFPTGVAAGIGEPEFLQLRGVNLPEPPTGQAPRQARVLPQKAATGAILPIREATGGAMLISSRSVVVAEGPQIIETEPNETPAGATPVGRPGGASGRIGREGDVDFYRFEAKKGERTIVEVYGRRIGSPIDPIVEVVDPKGAPMVRAILRPVEETNVAFRDHTSSGRNIRLTKWDDLAVGDYLLVGRELTRIAALPRNPDDDAIMWGLGDERPGGGERLGFLETTPEHHPFMQPMLKVEIHPPGSTFPAGGRPPIPLSYRNDDGGPGFGRDSRLTFDPPADGTYLARVEDVRGVGGDDYGYQLVVRPARPDFAVSLSTDDPNVPRGGATIVKVLLTRKDGFAGAVDVAVEGLPPGIRATSARIEPEAYGADLLLMADESAPAFSPPTWRVVATSAEPKLRREVDPGGPIGGRITVTAPADLRVSASPEIVTIRPGERVEMTFTVDRSPAFAGRVPIDVRNLPRGLRVLNIGLNGVLVTEKERSRSIFLYAEPWVAPVDRPFYAVARVESTGLDASSPPITLKIAPGVAARPSP